MANSAEELLETEVITGLDFGGNPHRDERLFVKLIWIELSFQTLVQNDDREWEDSSGQT